MNSIKIKQKEISFIIVTKKISKEGDGFVATCLELDIASQGDTIEEADKNLDGAVSCYLNTLADMGTTEEIFRSKNITLYKYPKTPDRTVMDIHIDKESFITTKTFDVAC